MKLPSILKIPSYQRFNYEPRHYDPIKEDIEERRQRIRRIIEADKKSGKHMPGARLEGAFSRRKPVKESEGLIRLAIAAILFSAVVGYLYFGNIAVYIATGLVLVYVMINKFKLFTK